jgi:hypothetical protein
VVDWIYVVLFLLLFAGFPRVYRRLLEGLNNSPISPSNKRIVRGRLKDAMRFPDTAMTVLSQNETIDFLTSYANQISTSMSNKLPPFFLIFAKMVAKQTPFGSILDYAKRFKEKP